MRLNSDTTLDQTFNAASLLNATGMAPGTLAVQPDGKVLVTVTPTNSAYARLIRLNADGSLDPSLNVSFQPNYYGGSIVGIPAGFRCVLVSSPAGTIVQRVIFRLIDLGEIPVVPAQVPWPASNVPPAQCIDYWTGAPALAGFPDFSFDLESHSSVTGREIDAAAINSGGAIFVGGRYDFSMASSRGFVTYRVAKLSMDGSLDRTFRVETNLVADVKAILPSPDGRVVVAFGSRIMRFLEDGSSDPTFADEINGGTISTVSATRDGHFLVAGGFHSRLRGGG
jgi:hypothetical protein